MPNRIKEVRLRKGMSQLQLARMLGVHPSYLNKVEREKTSVSVRFAMRIANALGCTLNDLFYIQNNDQ